MMDLPFVSVIMPIRNEADFIQSSLGAILAQDYPADRMEVLIADGMSTDATRSLIQSTAASNPTMSVRVIDNPGQIVPSGFNLALREARGEIIVRVDGHTLIETNYVRACVEVLERSGADNVGGRMNARGTTSVGRAVALATSSPFGVGGARFHYSTQEEWVDTVYMGAWPRTVFDRIGLFDEEMVRNQDDEFNYRLNANGGQILLSPAIRSTYYNRGNIARLWSQYFQYGYWKVRVMQKHPGEVRLRQLAPGAFVLGLLVGGLVGIVVPLVRVLWLLLIGVYLVANAAATIWTGYRLGWGDIWLVPLAFAIVHIGYGAGFLVGFGRFVRRW